MKTNITIFLLLLSVKSYTTDLSDKEEIEFYKKKLTDNIRTFNEKKLPELSIDEIINKLNTMLGDSDDLVE